MDIKTSTETHCGIVWECLVPEGATPAYFTGVPWCVDYNEKDKCWTLWKSLDLVFESKVLNLVFMVASEMILEDLASGFIPMWEQK